MLASGGLAKIKKANLKRLKPVVRQAAARPLHRQRAQFHRHRPQLLRPRRGSRHADPEGADHLQQGADLHLRAERRHHHPEASRPSSTTRSSSASSSASARATSPRTRRRTRSPAISSRNDVSERVVPDRALRRPVEQGQGLRDLRAARAVVRHQGRDQGPAEPRHVARRQRREAPARQRPRP